MKLFAAALLTETNTFAPSPTGLDGFAAYGIHRGSASRDAPDSMLGATLGELHSLANADGHMVIESVAAMAQPSGRTVQQVYERFRSDILEDLQAAMPVDAVVLVLHGAMVAEDCDDCEGDLISAIRGIVGEGIPIGVELDLHCHFTEVMRATADIVVCYKEYPHTDILDRLREVYALTMDTAQGKIRPVTAVRDCRMVGVWHTTKEPMIGFVKRMQALEGKNGILSVSFGHGFPWGDVVDSGAKVWVIANGDVATAQKVADELFRELWDMREATRPSESSIDSALNRAEARMFEGRPIVLADVADNPGGGAPCDSTFILRRLVSRGMGNAAFGCFYDLGAVQVCREAGVGTRLTLRIGGKLGESSGDPIDLSVIVRALKDDHHQTMNDSRLEFGASAWVATDDDVDIVLVSRREQTFSPAAFTGLGIDLTKKNVVVVKSTQHFHAGFAPIAREIVYVSAPGAITLDFANIPYQLRSLIYWPKVEDPFSKSS